MADELPVTRLRRPLSRAASALVAALGLALCAMPLQAQAQTQDQESRRYQVEVLVFLQPEGTSAERPPRADPEPEANPSAGLFSSAPAPLETTPALPANFAPPAVPMELQASATALGRRGYRVLWHQAWVQPVASADGLDIALLAALGNGPADPGLSGTLSLSTGRFLHLGVMLEWRRGGVLEARMDQRRRVRPDSEHYFDHPRLGVLARVKRLDSAAAD